MAKLTKAARDGISATKFAFPKQRKEPLENASHVRNAVAGFHQVKDVTEAERRAAWNMVWNCKSPSNANTPRTDYLRDRGYESWIRPPCFKRGQNQCNHAGHQSASGNHDDRRRGP